MISVENIKEMSALPGIQPVIDSSAPPYGEPTAIDVFLQNAVTLNEDNGDYIGALVWMDNSYLDYDGDIENGAVKFAHWLKVDSGIVITPNAEILSLRNRADEVCMRFFINSDNVPNIEAGKATERTIEFFEALCEAFVKL